MDRANNIFDQIDKDQSGGLDKGEITIHLLGLGQEQETVMEMFALLDADNDGLISREEFVNGFQKYQEFCKLSTNNRPAKASSKAPPPSHLVFGIRTRGGGGDAYSWIEHGIGSGGGGTARET